MTLRDFYKNKDYYYDEWNFYSRMAVDHVYSNPQKAKEYREKSNQAYNKYARMRRFEQETLEKALKNVDNNRF